MAEGQQQQQPTWTPQQIEAWRNKILSARRAARDKRGPGGHIWAKPVGPHRTVQTPGGMRRYKVKPGQRVSTGGGTRSANPWLDSIHALRRGTDAPIRLGKMSWKGHGASPRRREARKLERGVRHARQVDLNKGNKAKADADRRDMDQRLWNRETDQTRRDRLSRWAKDARRRGATADQIGEKSRGRQRQAIELGKLKKRERIWEQLSPGKETIAWDSMSPEEQDKLIRGINI